MKFVALATLVGSALLMSCSQPAVRGAESGQETVSRAAPADLMSWADLTGRPLPSPTTTRRYASGDAGVIDVWIPDGIPPYPVVLMIHGGCWQKAIADRTLMNYAAEDLRRDGIAVWNVEYRGVDEAGGGFPGTFEDVSQAADLIRIEGPGLGLDISNIVAFGHSAGGHLAGWIAGRPNLPAASAMRVDDPLPIKGVINSGGLADLEASAPLTLTSCLSDIIDQLTGAPAPGRTDILADTSVAALLPLPAQLINASGDQDRISPPRLGRSLTQKAREVGGQSAYYEFPDSGHVELIAPGTPAFEMQKRLIMALLNETALPEGGE